jgi:hypothetical protein
VAGMQTTLQCTEMSRALQALPWTQILSDAAGAVCRCIYSIIEFLTKFATIFASITGPSCTCSLVILVVFFGNFLIIPCFDNTPEP